MRGMPTNRNNLPSQPYQLTTNCRQRNPDLVNARDERRIAAARPEFKAVCKYTKRNIK